LIKNKILRVNAGTLMGIVLDDHATRSSGVAGREQVGPRAPECRPWGNISTLFTVI